MKLNGIEIRKPPFTDEYLDEVIEKSDSLIDLRPKILEALVDISKEFTVVYIHEYEDRYMVGVKID